MTLNDENFARNGIILPKTPPKRGITFFLFVFVKIVLFFLALKLNFLTYILTLNHQTTNFDMLLRQNYILIDVLHLFLIMFAKNRISIFYVLKLSY